MRTLKDLLKRLLCWALLLALLVLAAVGVVLGVQGWKLYRVTQPELPAAQLYETLSAHPGFTTCDAIPQTYIDAVIAVEDSRFELHHGVDPVAIVRALWTDPLAGRRRQHPDPAAGKEHLLHAGEALCPQGGGTFRGAGHRKALLQAADL